MEQSLTDNVKIVECPRDAMQGYHHLIPTEKKIEYIDTLLKAGFDFLDCGSFVSAKAVPMLADTAEVLKAINTKDSTTRLLVIVANERGATEASGFENITSLGYPFSISEQFQLRNTNHTIQQSLGIMDNIQKTALSNGKELVVYLSMGFGNPYNEPWDIQTTLDWCKRIADKGIKTISLSDTIGVANHRDISMMFEHCSQKIQEVEFGAHFHTRPDNYLQNISAAFEAGCRRFDTAMRGFGGCPFATDKLTGNLPTEALLSYLNEIGVKTGIRQKEFDEAFLMAGKIFN